MSTSGRIGLSGMFMKKAGFFTPPYETVSSLKARLDGMYTDVDMGNLKSMAWFACRKAG